MSDGAPAALVAMRLADMRRMHPRQDNSRVCSKCGHKVGIYPTGQNALRAYPQMAVLCSVCATAEPRGEIEALPAGALDEIIQESRESFDVERK